MPVKKGDEVKLHLSGKLKNGKVFATTEDKQPIEFEAGAGEILAGIDEAVIGMEKGEEKEITLPPEKAFGKRKEELVMKFDKDKFKGKRLEVGQRISVKTRIGRTMSAQVMKIGEDRVTLDLNYPLAGKELIFKIKVVDVEEKENK
ncbi:MAG: peptidylprolyl isomerase [bacterium]